VSTVSHLIATSSHGCHHNEQSLKLLPQYGGAVGALEQVVVVVVVMAQRAFPSFPSTHCLRSSLRHSLHLLDSGLCQVVCSHMTHADDVIIALLIADGDASRTSRVTCSRCLFVVVYV
jgi:hypothetical protein